MAKSTPIEHKFLEPDEWQTMSALLLLHRRVVGDLDAALRREAGISVMEFDVLITLFNAREARLGMTALANEVMLSPAGTTHLVTRLERDGLVHKEVDKADRRKYYAVLTEAGDVTLAAARLTHNRVLRSGLLAITNSRERQMLQRIWQRLVASPGPD